MASGETTAEAWRDVGPVTLATEALLAIPPANVVHGYARLARNVTKVVHILDAVSKHLGFEIGVAEGADQKFLYFT